MLEGGGGWRNLDFMTASLLGKRARSPDAGSDDTADMEETHRALFPFFETQNIDDEEEVEGSAPDLVRREHVFQKAAEILHTEVPHGNRLWMSSIVKRNIGCDAQIHRSNAGYNLAEEEGQGGSAPFTEYNGLPSWYLNFLNCSQIQSNY
ncbi:hypothetical protein DFH08DRAFT_823381 [Mycena albidolilacea]|uniref:Uncharacterized protein n=1 Tax=Mycena albidolilacea TaxID=1033008 RepID=A0AAD7EC40_9AGAR|nr:hypothetical protein DFH08DRAFT_823381 [Mycena albidolilacea]